MSRRTWVWLVVLSGLLMALGILMPGWTEAPRGKKYALLVGVRSYDHRKLTDLKYTENDVEELAKLLKQGGYNEVVLLTTTRGNTTKSLLPTRSNIEKELDRLLEKVTKHDVVLIGLAGHGLQYRLKIDGKERDESFFCPKDAKPIDTSDYKTLAKTMLPFREMFKKLDDSGAGSRLLLIDACRDDPTSGRNVKTEAMPRPASGTAALFSCKSGERAFETAKLGKGHGVFFYHVIQGLKKEARNKKGQVTWSRLAAYVQESVPDDVETIIRGGAKQTPHLMANIEGDPVLLRPGKEVVPKTITSSIGMKLVLIPEGSFKMGSPKAEREDVLVLIKEKAIVDWLTAEAPQHDVKISKAFYMGVYEVTQAQYEKVMGKNPSYFDKDGGGKESVKDMDTSNFPVDSVSWEDAQAFLKKLSGLEKEKNEGRKYRLPTEAEWEYACRGGASASNPFHHGKSLSSTQANFHGKYPFGGADEGPALNRTCKVGSYKPNQFGLYDMHGNVWEWCHDFYDKDYYSISRKTDPAGPDNKRDCRVLRGGAWSYGAHYCRAACRGNFDPGYRNSDIGFRVVCAPVARAR